MHQSPSNVGEHKRAPGPIHRFTKTLSLEIESINMWYPKHTFQWQLSRLSRCELIHEEWGFNLWSFWMVYRKPITIKGLWRTVLLNYLKSRHLWIQPKLWQYVIANSRKTIIKYNTRRFIYSKYAQSQLQGIIKQTMSLFVFLQAWWFCNRSYLKNNSRICF